MRFEISALQIPRQTLIVVLLSLTGLAAFFLFTETYIYGIGLLALPLLILCLRFPQVWLYTSMVLLAIWFRSSDKGVSIIETFMVAFYLGGLGIWFISQFVAGERIARNWPDRALLFLFGLAFAGNGFIALFNGNSLLLWIRELLLFSFVLYYFPIRTHIREKKHVVIMLLLLAGVVFFLGITNIQLYIRATTNVVQAYELLNSRVSLNESLFVGGVILSTTFFLFTRPPIIKLLLLFLAVYCTGILIASLSRGPWLAAAVGITVVFYFAERRKKILMAGSVLVASVALITVIGVFFGDMGAVIIEGIQRRFISYSSSGKDVSVAGRLAESAAALQIVEDHPLSGVGMGNTFIYHDPVTRAAFRGNFVHNGYVFLAMKLGIPLAGIFFCALIGYLFIGLRSVRLLKSDTFYRYVAIGGTSGLLASLVLAIPANQFIIRDGLFLLALYVALIAVADGRACDESIAKSYCLPVADTPPQNNGSR